MDLLWRVVTDFFMHDRSLHVRGAIDKSRRKIIMHDDASPLERSSLRTWQRLSRKTPSNMSFHRLAKAVEARDAEAMRHLVSAAIHRTCIRVRIVSQTTDEPHSIHLLWCSAVHNADAPTGCIHSPRAEFPSGMSIAVTVHESILPWISNVFYAYPSVQEDPGMWMMEGRMLQTADQFTGATPSKRVDISAEALDVSGASPVLYDGGSEVEKLHCVGCCDLFPYSFLTFVEKCGHSICIACAAACARKHVEAPHCTRGNMPCPAMYCRERLSAMELRALVSEDDFEVCEFNEVYDALDRNGAVCPNCSCVYERVEVDDAADGANSSALRDRFVCKACSTEFCVKCGVFPFHEGKPCRALTDAPVCRYCGGEAEQEVPCICSAAACVEKGKQSCTIVKRCGHLCCGTKGEQSCVSCLHEGCSDVHAAQRESDLCVICYVDCLSEAPCLQLSCGHVFHTECLRTRLARKWPTPRITFHFMDCPFCGTPVNHLLLKDLLRPLLALQATLEARYVERLRIEDLLESSAITDRASQYFNDPISYGKDNLTYYECARCGRAYFGGLKQCNDVVAEDADRADLICGGCTAGNTTACDKHGTDFIQYKCKYCCNLAVWFCWGTTHFCEMCHNPPRRTVREECPGEERCPLRGQHPPNGSEFAISCALCSSVRKKPEQS